MAAPQNIAGLAIRPRDDGGRGKADGAVLVADRPGSISNVGAMGRLFANQCSGRPREWMYVGVPYFLFQDASARLLFTLAQLPSSIQRARVLLEYATLGDAAYGTSQVPLMVQDAQVGLSGVECDPLFDQTACEVTGNSHVNQSGDLLEFVAAAGGSGFNAFRFTSLGAGADAWLAAGPAGLSDGLGAQIARV